MAFINRTLYTAAQLLVFLLRERSDKSGETGAYDDITVLMKFVGRENDFASPNLLK